MSQAAPRRSRARVAWTALLVALVADALLAPFYPQFFARTFGGNGVVTAGLYIALCRVAVAVTLPFWTRWTRRVAPLRLVAVAQGVAGVAALGCAMAPSLGAFLALTFVAEGARAAYLLLYPVLFEAAPTARRGALVARVAAAFHGAALIAALLGGVVLDHLGGRTALLMAAFADFAQLAILWPILAHERVVAVADAASGTPPSAIAVARARRRLLLLCALTFLATSAIVVLRPHFTTFVADAISPSLALWQLGAIFVVPSIVAVAVLPFGQRVAHSSRLVLYLAVALLAMSVTAGAQLVAPTLVALIAARALYGLASYVVDVGVDYHALCGDGDDAYGHFGVVGAVQNVAIVVAPLLAAVLADRAGWPALFGTAIALSTAAAVAALAFRAAAAPRPAADMPASSPASSSTSSSVTAAAATSVPS